MKKLTIILLAVAIVALPSCKNRKNAQNQEAKDYTEATAEELNEEELKANMAALIESAKKIKPVPFVKATQDGTLVLSEKEKMVKPDYLLNPAKANNLATLYQKYRAVGMFTADKNIHHTHEGSIGNLCNDRIAALMQQIITDFHFECAEEAEKRLLADK